MTDQQYRREEFETLEMDAKMAPGYKQPHIWGLGVVSLEDGSQNITFWRAAFGSTKSAAVLFGASEQSSPGELRTIKRRKLERLLPLFQAFKDPFDADQQFGARQIRHALIDALSIIVGEPDEQAIVLGWIVEPEDEPDNDGDAQLLAFSQLPVNLSDDKLDEDLESTLPYPPGGFATPKAAVG